MLDEQLLGKGWSYPVQLANAGMKTKSGLHHLEQSIFIILITPKGSRLMRPLFGSELWRYIDSPINQRTLALMRAEIFTALKEETRGRVTKIVIENPETHQLLITVHFLVQNEITIAVRLGYDQDKRKWEEVS